MQFTNFMKGQTSDLSIIKKEDYVKAIEFLITDENEAVSGYDKAILLFTNGNREDKTSCIDKLTEIKNEELVHIKELKTLLEKLK